MIQGMLFRTIKGYELSLPWWRRWIFRWKLRNSRAYVAFDMGARGGDLSSKLTYKIVDGITFIMDEEQLETYGV